MINIAMLHIATHGGSNIELVEISICFLLLQRRWATIAECNNEERQRSERCPLLSSRSGKTEKAQHTQGHGRDVGDQQDTQGKD